MLDDVLAPGLKIVFCGSAASSVSAVRGEYYAGPGNKFWPVLHRTGLTPQLLTPAEYRDLPRFGLGLTDVVKGQSGGDAEIDFRRSDPAGVRAKVLEFAPAVLAFNGKKAAQVFLGCTGVEYGLQPERVGATQLFVAPSTSGAANGFWDEAWWVDLAARIYAAPAPERAAASRVELPSDYSGPTSRRDDRRNDQHGNHTAPARVRRG